MFVCVCVFMRLYGLFAAYCVMLYNVFVCLVCVSVFLLLKKVFVIYVCDLVCDVVWCVTMFFFSVACVCV